MKHLALAGLIAAPCSAAAFDVADVVDASVLAGWRMENGQHMAALRFRLEPGWKTYWRSPGDAGIPPRFDWSGSDNVSSVAIHWPVPTAFDQSGMRSIGYSGDIIVPIEVTVSGEGAVALEGTVEIGVCQDICVPVSFAVQTALPEASDSPHAGEIRTALADRPLTASEAGASNAVCASEPISDGMRLTVTMDLPPIAEAETTVIEIADASVWVSPAKTSRDGNRLTAVAELVPASATPFAIARGDLRFTVLGDGRAVDIQGCTGG